MDLGVERLLSVIVEVSISIRVFDKTYWQYPSNKPFTLYPKEIPLCYATILSNIPNYLHLFSPNKINVYLNLNTENVTESLKGNQLLNTFRIVMLLMFQCNLLNRNDCC